MCAKLILSRKGFDSGTGGKANWIYKDALYPIPIPQKGSHIYYRALPFKNAQSYGDMMASLRIKTEEEAHLDPDLSSHSLSNRLPGWRPSFGQHGAALSHLLAEGVGPGDLFLFFGWFREIVQHGEKWRYKPRSADLHILYGWLEIGEMIDLAKQKPPDWAQYHPHWQCKDSFRRGGNMLFTATENSTWNAGTTGAGIFSNHPDRCLTLQDGTNRKRSLWKLPKAFFGQDNHCRLSYHRHKKGQGQGPDRILQSAARGQEFVCDINPEIRQWLDHRIFARH